MSTVDRDHDPSEEWQATRVLAPSHIAPEPSPGPYVDGPAPDVGRQTVPNEHELFVSCDPGPALQQQFDHLRPEFIVVHDVGTTSSRKLLAGIAAAAGRVLQKLVIRRQGYGTALATVPFVELPTNDGRKLRLYTTECETEPAWRAELVQLLLSHSRLAVVMVGDMPAPNLGPALRPLREAMTQPSWQNRQLLLLPLSSASNLVTHGMELARGTEINVRTAPQVARPADAWGFISGTWSRMNDRAVTEDRSSAALGPLFTPVRAPAGEGTASANAPHPAPSRATSMQVDAPDTAPAVLTRLPERPTDSTFLGSAPSRPAPLNNKSPSSGFMPPKEQPATADVLRRYARQISEVAGVGSCCVFHVSTAQSVAYAGSGQGALALATQGASLWASIIAGSERLALGKTLQEAALTLGPQHILLRAVPRHPELGMIALLDKPNANLTMMRLQVLRMDPQFESDSQ
jgi:hypothetical protein